MERYRELESRVIKWAFDKGIFDKGSTIKQADKTLEEVHELIEAVKKDDDDEIIDALGDILVTIIIQAYMNEVDMLDCLETALNVIEKRTGKMIDGQFVKDND